MVVLADRIGGSDGGSSGNTINIRGSLDTVASQDQTIDFYASSSADPSGYGEGRRWADENDVDFGQIRPMDHKRKRCARFALSP